MKSLSSILYTIRNFKKALTTILAILIGVGAVYFLNIVRDTTISAVKLFNENFYENVSVLYPNTENGITDEILDKLKMNNTLLIPTKDDLGDIVVTQGLGLSTIKILNLYYEDIDKLFKIEGYEMVEGEYPKDSSEEILIHEIYARQNNLEVGSIVNKDSSNIHSDTEFKVSGIYKGKSVAAIGNENYYHVSRNECFKYGVIYSNSDNSLKDMKDIINEDKLTIYDYKKINEVNENLLVALNLFSDNLSYFMIVILCITLGNLNYIHFKKRREEFFILNSIGYKKSTLVVKLLKENAIASIIGYIVGIIFTTLIVLILNILVFTKEARDFALYSQGGMLNTLIIPVAVSILSILPCMRKMFKEGEF